MGGTGFPPLSDRILAGIQQQMGAAPSASPAMPQLPGPMPAPAMNLPPTTMQMPVLGPQYPPSVPQAGGLPGWAELAQALAPLAGALISRNPLVGGSMARSIQRNQLVQQQIADQAEERRIREETVANQRAQIVAAMNENAARRKQQEADAGARAMSDAYGKLQAYVLSPGATETGAKSTAQMLSAAYRLPPSEREFLVNNSVLLLKGIQPLPMIMQVDTGLMLPAPSDPEAMKWYLSPNPEGKVEWEYVASEQVPAARAISKFKQDVYREGLKRADLNPTEQANLQALRAYAESVYGKADEKLLKPKEFKLALLASQADEIGNWVREKHDFPPDEMIRKWQVDKAAAKSQPDNSLDELARAIIANPDSYNTLSASVKAKVLVPLAKMGFTGFAKPPSQSMITKMEETQSAIELIQALRVTISENLQYIGPIAGLQALSPWSDARKVQADIDRVKQRIGKALEGGVLRKEDEEKYKKILATVTDTPKVALYKIDGLTKDLERNLSNYGDLLRGAGYRTPPKEPSLNDGIPEIRTTPDGKKWRKVNGGWEEVVP